MSIRQPKDRRQKATSNKRAKGEEGKRVKGDAAPRASLFPSSPFTFFPLTSVLHICHLQRPEASEELGGALAVELGVGRLDEDEEAVARGEREVRRVEDRVVRLRQPVQGEHAEDGEERRAQDRALEGDGDERGPAVVGLAADVDREVDDLDVDLQKEAERAAEQAPD